MSFIDLASTLAEWPYDAEQISVRKILGADGQVRIQMRVELGLLQMEPDGRPDGVRPHGFESVLQFQQRRLAEHEERNGTVLGFELSPADCHELRNEASLFYRRYVALFVLEEFEDVARDTDHTLGIFDLCRDYAGEQDDRTCLNTYRPYVIMMNARAHAYRALQEDEPASALAHVNRGITHLRTFFEQQGKPQAMENCEEVKMLRNVAAEVTRLVPRDSLVATRKALREAIEQERFEDAARLRDALEKLTHREPPLAADSKVDGPLDARRESCT